jgi:lysozyme family protein
MMRDIPDNHVEEIYKDMYWEVVRADDLPAGVDLCVFDFGVNAGPVRSAKMLQSCVDATEDGVIGPKTLARVSEQDTEELIKLFSVKREEYYKSLRHFETFGRGWLRRNEDVRDTAIDMI